MPFSRPDFSLGHSNLSQEVGHVVVEWKGRNVSLKKWLPFVRPLPLVFFAYSTQPCFTMETCFLPTSFVGDIFKKTGIAWMCYLN